MILNYECNRSEYDICLAPKKSIVQFKDWQLVLTATEALMKRFFIENNVLVKTEVTGEKINGSSPSKNQNSSADCGRCDRSLPQDRFEFLVNAKVAKNSIWSLPAKRCRVDDNSGVEFKILKSEIGLDSPFFVPKKDSVPCLEISLRDKTETSACDAFTKLKQKISSPLHLTKNPSICKGHRQKSTIRDLASKVKKAKVLSGLKKFSFLPKEVPTINPKKDGHLLCENAKTEPLKTLLDQNKNGENPTSEKSDVNQNGPDSIVSRSHEDYDWLKALVEDVVNQYDARQNDQAEFRSTAHEFKPYSKENRNDQESMSELPEASSQTRITDLPDGVEAPASGLADDPLPEETRPTGCSFETQTLQSFNHESSASPKLEVSIRTPIPVNNSGNGECEQPICDDNDSLGLPLVSENGTTVPDGSVDCDEVVSETPESCLNSPVKICALEPTVDDAGPNGGWITEMDSFGNDVYVNTTNGNSSYTKPPELVLQCQETAESKDSMKG